jgi:hypothetical protein
MISEDDHDEYVSQTLRMAHEAEQAAERDCIVVLLLTVAAAFFLTLRYLV